MYLAIFAPKYITYKMDDVVYTGNQATKNPYHDLNKDGIITKREISKNIKKHYTSTSTSS